MFGTVPVTWATFIFDLTAGLFLAMTLAALWNLRWVHRLPTLDALAPPNRSGQKQCALLWLLRPGMSRIESRRP